MSRAKREVGAACAFQVLQRKSRDNRPGPSAPKPLSVSTSSCSSQVTSAFPLSAFQLSAFYLARSRSSRPLPRGLTGHVTRPTRSIPPFLPATRHSSQVTCHFCFSVSAFLAGHSSPVTRHFSLGQAARSFAAIWLYSASGSFLLGAGVPGAFPPKEGMT